MKVYSYPCRDEWALLTERPHTDLSQLSATVNEIIDDVKANGDAAVMAYEQKFDHATLTSLAVADEDMNEAVDTLSPDLGKAMDIAYRNIRKFHAAQLAEHPRVETAPGVVCWQKSVPIERVGLYIPGGTAPLFSTVLMLATPAKIAGCREIVLCTPPGKDGKINPAILAAARMAGVSRIFKIGGVQAIAAMALGTETVPKVSKIFGPGNQYVMAAKQQVSLHDVAIDMPAGPSEVCVVADDSSNPEYVAADLLSQAEHGVDSQVLLISTSERLAHKVEHAVAIQLEQLPRKEIAAKTLANSKIIVVHDKDEAMQLSNMYAPEHLIIATDDYDVLAEKVVNAGSVFLGKLACESAGDYASGTNHTLPTHGYATAYSGVNLDSFMRKITFQHISEEGIRSIGRAVETMAHAECLDAHRNAMSVRMKDVER